MMAQKLATTVELASEIWADPMYGDEFWSGEIKLNGHMIIARSEAKSREEMVAILTKALLQRFPDADPKQVFD